MTDEELKRLTVADIIDRADFVQILGEQIGIELGTREKAMQEARAKKMRLQRNVLDSLIEKDVMKAETMRDVFRAELDKKLIGFSMQERNYIHAIGMLAFGKVLGKLKQEVKDE